MAFSRCVDEQGRVVIPQLDMALQAGQEIHYEGQDYVVQPGSPRAEQDKSMGINRWCQVYVVKRSAVERNARGPAIRG
jgi:hypothetical protein